MKMRRAYTDGPYGQIHYQYAPAGKPLVLMHQSVMSSDQFAYVFEPLYKRGYQAIAIDMPGFGMSDPTDFVPSIPDFGNCVVPVLDALGIEKAAIAGHHSGALVAPEVALANPDRISAVIIGGALMLEESVRQYLMDDIVGREKAFKALPEAAHMRDLWVARHKYAQDTVSLDRLSDYVVMTMMARGAKWYGHHAAFKYYQEPALEKLQHPTLLLSNSGDMLHESTTKVAALHPRFAFHTIEGGGIDIVDTHPEEWANAIADFLDAQPA